MSVGSTAYGFREAHRLDHVAAWRWRHGSAAKISTRLLSSRTSCARRSYAANSSFHWLRPAYIRSSVACVVSFRRPTLRFEVTANRLIDLLQILKLNLSPTEIGSAGR